MKITPNNSIGIIGGAGRTGSQFATLFREQGFSVTVTGSSTATQNAEMFRSCDIVIFAVPLSSSLAIMEEEIKYATREDQLILDVSSLKTKQVELMQKAAGEVIGMHPLFGPQTEVVGQTIVLCPQRCEPETLESVKTFFSALSMQITIMDVKEHDQLMSLLQVLPHIKSFLVADVLHKIGDDVIGTIDRTATPAYRIELNLVARFLDDSPDLYGPIILDNPETINILTLLHQSLGELIQMAENEDLTNFSKKYEVLKAFFGHHTREGRKKIEACIRTLTSLKKQ
jgi:prephenate dehydrogenase